MSVDPFGDLIDADTIEQAAVASLKRWLPDYLAGQERRKAARITAAGLPSGWHIPRPRSWPTLGDFELEPHIQTPAVVLVSPGAEDVPEVLRDGSLRQNFGLELAVVVGGNSIDQARLVASMYIAAVKGAMRHDRTLGGIAEKVRITGRDDHAYGTADQGGARAIYGCPFAVTVRDTPPPVTQTDPSADPYHPVPYPPTQLQADIVVTVTPTDQEVETP